jgi:hypothetical protein
MLVSNILVMIDKDLVVIETDQIKQDDEHYHAYKGNKTVMVV